MSFCQLSSFIIFAFLKIFSFIIIFFSKQNNISIQILFFSLDKASCLIAVLSGLGMAEDSLSQNNDSSKKRKNEITEILDYKKRLQAYIIHFERLRNWDIISKLEAADRLLDQNLKDFLPDSEIGIA